MQVVAVTDPLELGFARQAMIGIRATGDLETVADALADDGRGRLRRGRGRQLRPPGRGRVRERRAPARDRVQADPHAPRRAVAPRPSSTCGCASRPTRGACADVQRTAELAVRVAVALARHRRRRLDAARRRCPGSTDVRRRDRRRRLHRAVDRVLPAPGRPGLRIARPRARDGGLRRLRPQRRLVLGAVPDVRRRGRPAAGRRRRRCDVAARGDARHRRRGRPGGRSRGHRRALHQGRDGRRSPAPRSSSRRLRAEVAHARAWGQAPDDLRLLDARGGTRAGARPPACSAATFTPDCAAVHPARLVRGLARAVERRGVRIHEQTRSRDPRPGGCAPPRARSGPTSSCGPPRATPRRSHGERRRLAPVYSLMVATEPLPDDAVGTDRARRPADVHRAPAPDRLRPAHRRRPAGLRRSRGAVPLRLAGPPRVRPRADGVPAAARRRCATCSRRCDDAAFTHALGRAARRSPATGTRRSGWTARTGLAWAGGYVGDGVSTTNLAGRTLRDLILGRRHRADRAAVGPAPVPAVGAGAAALARRQRRTARDDARRRARSGSPAGRAGIARAMSPFVGGH